MADTLLSDFSSTGRNVERKLGAPLSKTIGYVLSLGASLAASSFSKAEEQESAIGDSNKVVRPIEQGDRAESFPDGNRPSPGPGTAEALARAFESEVYGMSSSPLDDGRFLVLWKAYAPTDRIRALALILKDFKKHPRRLNPDMAQAVVQELLSAAELPLPSRLSLLPSYFDFAGNRYFFRKQAENYDKVALAIERELASLGSPLAHHALTVLAREKHSPVAELAAEDDKSYGSRWVGEISPFAYHRKFDVSERRLLAATGLFNSDALYDPDLSKDSIKFNQDALNFFIGRLNGTYHLGLEQRSPMPDRPLIASLERLQAEIETLLGKKGLSPEQSTATSQFMLGKEYERLAAVGYAVVRIRRARGESRAGLAIHKIDEELDQIAITYDQPGAPKTEAVEHIERGDLAWPRFAGSIAPVKRQISRKEWRYRETLQITPDDGPSSVFEWTGVIPLNMRYGLERHIRLLDYCDYSLALRERGLLLSGRPLHDLDYVQAAPCTALSMLFADGIGKPVPGNWLRQALIHLGLTYFPLDEKLDDPAEVGVSAPQPIPGLGILPHGDEFSHVLKAPDFSARIRSVCDEPPMRLLNGRARQVYAAHIQPAVNEIPATTRERIEQHQGDSVGWSYITVTNPVRSTLDSQLSTLRSEGSKWTKQYSDWDLGILASDPVEQVRIICAYLNDSCSTGLNVLELHTKSGARRLVGMSAELPKDLSRSLEAAISADPKFLERWNPDLLGVTTDAGDEMHAALSGAYNLQPYVFARRLHGMSAAQYREARKVPLELMNDLYMDPALVAQIQFSRQGIRETADAQETHLPAAGVFEKVLAGFDQASNKATRQAASEGDKAAAQVRASRKGGFGFYIGLNVGAGGPIPFLSFSRENLQISLSVSGDGLGLLPQWGPIPLPGLVIPNSERTPWRPRFAGGSMPDPSAKP